MLYITDKPYSNWLICLGLLETDYIMFEQPTDNRLPEIDLDRSAADWAHFYSYMSVHFLNWMNDIAEKE